MNRHERNKRRVASREQRGYPSIMGGVASVEDGEWLSQSDAAARLGIPMIRIGVLIACEHLVPVQNSAGHAGVTRAKLTRLAKDTIGFI